MEGGTQDLDQLQIKIHNPLKLDICAIKFIHFKV
jgi:hypothetical protein